AWRSGAPATATRTSAWRSPGRRRTRTRRTATCACGTPRPRGRAGCRAGRAARGTRRRRSSVRRPTGRGCSREASAGSRRANPAALRHNFELKDTDPTQRPVVAAAPRGRWLAVAGFKDRAIAIYAVADLLARKTEPAQRLRTNGVQYHKTLFVTRDKEQGLWL